MWGADAPHCRKPLWWKEFSFEPETRNNFQPGEKTYDQVSFDQQQFDWYKKLISIRKDNPILENGDIAFLLAEGKKLHTKDMTSKMRSLSYLILNPSKKTFPCLKTPRI